MNIYPQFSPRILTRLTSLLFTGAAIVVLLGFTAQKAYAHYPIVAATATCSNGAAVINYTVTSWNPGALSGSIAGVNVLFNGAIVDTEGLVLPLDTFSGMKPAPSGTNTVDVQAVPVYPYIWGDGQTYSTPSNVVTLTIPTNCAPGTGRFTGGGKQVTVNDATGDHVAVTKGFEVDCDLHQPSNNLEVNWQDPAQTAHQFHMTDFTSAVCTLTGIPNPPPAPVNNIIGTGTGRYDGTDGYTVVFQLIDNGEPGSGVDEASFMIYQTSNPSNVVLNAPLTFITGGNIQAHVDQH